MKTTSGSFLSQRRVDCLGAVLSKFKGKRAFVMPQFSAPSPLLHTQKRLLAVIYTHLCSGSTKLGVGVGERAIRSDALGNTHPPHQKKKKE